MKPQENIKPTTKTTKTTTKQTTKTPTETTKIGAFIKARRKERDLTQQQLAFHAGVSYTLVNRVENGGLNVRVESLNRLLNLFGYELGPVATDRPIDRPIDARKE
jgi:y4mF family transcriptional regulator